MTNTLKLDVLLYNSVDSAFDTTYKVNLVGSSDGLVVWIPPGLFTISCKLDIYWWPFDEQICFFKFGSWSFSGFQLDLVPGEFSTSEFLENGEWVLLSELKPTTISFIKWLLEDESKLL